MSIHFKKSKFQVILNMQISFELLVLENEKLIVVDYCFWGLTVGADWHILWVELTGVTEHFPIFPDPCHTSWHKFSLNSKETASICGHWWFVWHMWKLVEITNWDKFTPSAPSETNNCENKDFWGFDPKTKRIQILFTQAQERTRWDAAWWAI